MKLWKRIVSAAAVLAALCIAAAPAVLADYEETATEKYSRTERAEQVTLAEHTSYRSDYYGSVIHLQSGDTSVAVAAADSEGCVLITAIGAGSTTVSFWYKYGYYDSGDDWTLVTVPVKVTGKAAGASAVYVSAEEGLSFSQSSVLLEAGTEKSLDGILLNGSAADASSLLWLTTTDDVLSVERDTGKIRALQPGNGLLYVLTTDGRYSNCLLVTVE